MWVMNKVDSITMAILGECPSGVRECVRPMAERFLAFVDGDAATARCCDCRRNYTTTDGVCLSRHECYRL